MPEDEVISFEIEHTKELVKQVHWVWWAHRSGVWIALLSIAVLLVLPGAMRPWTDPEMASLYSGALILFALFVIISIALLLTSIAQDQGARLGRVQYEVSPKGLTINAPWGKTRHRWEEFEDRRNQRDIVFLRKKAGGFVAIPRKHAPGRALYFMKEHVSVPSYSEGVHHHD